MGQDRVSDMGGHQHIRLGPWPLVRLPAVAAVVGLLAASPAAAANATFELAQVIEALKQELAAAQAAGQGQAPLRIDEAQVDLDLVEIPGKNGSRLVVPGGDFAASGEAAPKPTLKRRVVVELVPAKEAKSADGAAIGNLARVIVEIKSQVRTGIDAAPPAELKRVGIDLEFVLERDVKGALAFVAFAADHRIEAKNVQKLKLKLSTKEK